MKRRVLFVVAVILIIIGLFIIVKAASSVLAPRGKGGLQVTSNIKAQVFVNNKSVGAAPLCLCEGSKKIASGDIDVRIVPDDKTIAPYLVKVKINPNVLTAVDRTFLPGALASSYVLMLEKTNEKDPQLFIATIPDGSLITLDGESQGITPLLIKPISVSEHEVEIEKPGFSKKTVRVRAVAGFKLVLNAVLGTEATAEELEQTTASASAETLPETPTPTPAGPRVLIGETPTGFLRVRSTASSGGAEIGQVKPGESYPYIDETEGWMQIELTDGQKGWVSKTYSIKQ